jgi:hypothetical protein
MPKCKTCGQDIPKKIKKPKVKKFKGSEEDWLKAAALLAFSYVPTIYHCEHCEYPVVDGYCCTNCDSEDPGDADSDGESTHYLFSWPEK